ncbi:MAG TPA: GNAT family N-acetyltransferase [Candidatus Limnocylindria bacterium]|jgi:GNAT superfamily N-acetyltransferase|nr:GNAT family N-acetyltransferase [Candidatus Limnocylindria bacterium]
MTEPAPVRVLPAAIERWDDVALLLDGDYGDKGCWCQAWRGRDAVARATGESRPQTLRRQLETDTPPPGFIAYLDDEPVGWCGVSVRTRTPRLLNSRTIPLLDDLPVWSIGCFRIRVGFRRRGVATALLSAVVEAARAAGAPAVEAYPIDPAGQRVDVGFAFVGIASMFDRAGFRRVMPTNARSAGHQRLLMRLELSQPNPGQPDPASSISAVSAQPSGEASPGHRSSRQPTATSHPGD